MSRAIRQSLPEVLTPLTERADYPKSEALEVLRDLKRAALNSMRQQESLRRGERESGKEALQRRIKALDFTIQYLETH